MSECYTVKPLEQPVLPPLELNSGNLATSISKTAFTQIDKTIQGIWKLVSFGKMDETDANSLVLTLEARRAEIKARRADPVKSVKQKSKHKLTSKRKLRRRAYARGRVVPDHISNEFTEAGAAVLAVAGHAVTRCKGRMDLAVGEIASLAGVSKRTVQATLHKAADLGLIKITERRIRWCRNLTNIVTIIDESWVKWLWRGGCSKVRGSLTKNIEKAKKEDFDAENLNKLPGFLQTSVLEVPT